MTGEEVTLVMKNGNHDDGFCSHMTPNKTLSILKVKSFFEVKRKREDRIRSCAPESLGFAFRFEPVKSQLNGNKCKSRGQSWQSRLNKGVKNVN